MLAPLVADYTQRLEDQLCERRYVGDLPILHSGGGVLTPAAAGTLAARIAGSGIAAGAIASKHIATRPQVRLEDGLGRGGPPCSGERGRRRGDPTGARARRGRSMNRCPATHARPTSGSLNAD